MAQLPPSHTPVNRCIAVDKHLALLRKSPDYRWRRTQIEREIDAWIDRYAADGLRSGLIRIPVVVHVVSNTAAQDISDAQIHSQIDVLNLDFRRLNADAVNTPAPFASVAADARLEFALAVRSPDCKPTNGITRTHTSVASWSYPNEGMKSAATGGADQWDPPQYLNIWIVNYAGGVLGYGTFPGGPAAIDGVVIHWQAFGTTGSLLPGAHLGRTATHEIGHYLDLHHIWGDDGSVCTDSDDIADTPNQLEDSPFDPSKCRTFPAVSCGNAPDGDMFMNYMDYSADQCFNMFTLGQAVRMDAALHTQRTTLLASPGLVPPAGIPGPDLWSKDVSDDMGQEPDTSTHPMYISDDIWVRQSNDGLANQDHQNPIHGQPSWVYVRVRNRSCGATQSGTVKLYWAKASSGLSWQAPWDGSVVAPALMGSPIGSAPVTVAGGDHEILTLDAAPRSAVRDLRRRPTSLLPAVADRDGAGRAVRDDRAGDLEPLEQRQEQQQHRLEEHHHRRFREPQDNGLHRGELRQDDASDEAALHRAARVTNGVRLGPRHRARAPTARRPAARRAGRRPRVAVGGHVRGPQARRLYRRRAGARTG